MAIETSQPEKEKEEQFTFTPHSPTPPPTPPPATPIAVTPATTDWRELRRQERAAHRAERHADGDTQRRSWIGGVVLILLGGIFLLQNTGIIEGFDNWWALFILIPAVGSFTTAWRTYQQAGNQWTAAATGALLGGLVLTSLSAMFLFGLDIGMWWPIFLIAGGIATLLGVRQWR